jgi:hypothetical protein
MGTPLSSNPAGIIQPPIAQVEHPIIAGRPRPQTPVTSSILDIEGVAQSLVKLDPGVEVKVASWFRVEECGGNGDQVVATDDALIGQALGGPDFDLGTDATDRSGDRRAGDRREDGDRGVPGEDTDGPPPRWCPQVRPDDVAALYHSGTVSAASREAAETIAGSWGTLR